MEVFLKVSFGELCDKYTILQIKSKRIRDINKLEDVTNELGSLQNNLNSLLEGLQKSLVSEVNDIISSLYSVNNELWDIENNIRECELNQSFDSAFIDLSRKIYFKNDHRAALKLELNKLTKSEFVEQKEHPTYSSDYKL